MKMERESNLMGDHGIEFDNSSFIEYCDELGIRHAFSSPINPQQNGVVERKNGYLVKSLEQCSLVMLSSSITPQPRL